MGLLEIIQQQRVYLDTNLWIYAIAAHLEYVKQMTELFSSIDHGDATAVTSELTLAEVLVKPCINKDEVTQAAYKEAIQSTAFLHVEPVSRLILMQAASLRATTNLKLPDTIHAATAISTCCTVFLTNDRNFQKISHLNAHLLSEFIEPKVEKS